MMQKKTTSYDYNPHHHQVMIPPLQTNKPRAVKLISHRETYGLPPGAMAEEESGIIEEEEKENIEGQSYIN